MPPLPFDHYGLLLRRTALQLGLDDNWLARMVRLGVIVRIRHGAYANANVWRTLTPADRHLLRCRAVMLQYDDRIALSHAGPHLLRGGPDWGLKLSTVNVTNLFGRGDRIQSGITHHRGITRVTDVSRLNGHWVTAPPRTAVELAATLDLAPAVCVLDWTLHRHLTTREELEIFTTVWLREWPGTIDLLRAVERSDGRSESVGETRSRLALEDLGFEPEPQWEVRLPSGRLAGRVDLLLRKQGVMIEFDGQVKYGRLLKPGQTIDDVIKAERDREVLLEELTGLRMLRLVWGDLDHPAQIAKRVNHVAAQRRAG
jgi:hypothetical protein